MQAERKYQPFQGFNDQPNQGALMTADEKVQEMAHVVDQYQQENEQLRI